LVTLVSCRDLVEMEFTENPIFDGLLDEKESLIIVGQSGISKSSCTLNAALQLAVPADGNMPNRLFNKFPIPKQRRSLFVQSENAAKATSKRLRKMIDAAPWLEDGLEGVLFASIR